MFMFTGIYTVHSNSPQSLPTGFAGPGQVGYLRRPRAPHELARGEPSRFLHQESPQEAWSDKLLGVAAFGTFKEGENHGI